MIDDEESYRNEVKPVGMSEKPVGMSEKPKRMSD